MGLSNRFRSTGSTARSPDATSGFISYRPLDRFGLSHPVVVACWRGVGIVALTIAAAFSVLGVLATAAGAATCATSAPASGAYSTSVCLDAPADGDELTGDVVVRASPTTTGSSPGVQKLVFYLGGEYVLTDYAPPYTFTLPTARFVDGARTLEVAAHMRDGFVSGRASSPVILDNGVTSPPVNTGTFSFSGGGSPPPGEPFVAAAVGDGAGGEVSATDVTNLIDSWDPRLFLYLGDVYNKGTGVEFLNWYAPDFGRLRSVTAPTIGNHEYENNQAPGYFDYWDNVPNYYSVDAGGWNVVSINSTTQFGQTGIGSPQYEWLRENLQANVDKCSVVYMHHPLYNIGPEGSATSLDQMWRLLTSMGADLVLTGHDHTYQRWRPLDGDGTASPAGLTEFVVGTGGHSEQETVTTDPRVVATNSGFGALRLELNAAGAAYRFATRSGLILDSGSVQCRGTAADAIAPTAPREVTASPVSRSQVDLSWKPANDNVGVTGHDIYRDGILVDSIGPAPAWSDASVSAGATYRYEVRARDAAGLSSDLSEPLTVSAPPETVLFSSGFETGSMSEWTFSKDVTVQSADVRSGAFAARIVSAGTTPTYAYRNVSPARPALAYRMRFKVVSQAPKTLNLMRFKTAADARLLTVYRNSSGKLGFRNELAATTNTSTTAVSTGSWHTLEVLVTINGASSQTQALFDGVSVAALSKTESLGATPIGRAEFGESTTGNSYEVLFDDIAFDPQLIGDSMPPSVPKNVSAIARSGLDVAVSWTASTDDTGVSGYDVYRDGALLATVGAGTTYTDNSVSPGTSYYYEVRAGDGAGNHSLLSTPELVVTPLAFSDGFESGDLTRWGSASGLAVQTERFSGSWGARATSTGAATSSYKILSRPLNELYYRIRFKLLSLPASQVNLLRFRTATGTSLLTAYVTNTGKLATRNDVGAITTTAAASVAVGRWHVLQARLRVNGTGTQDIWLDGTRVAELSGDAAFGSTAIGRIDLGDATGGRTYDVAFDDVDANIDFLADMTPPTPPTNLVAGAISSTTVQLDWTAASDDIAVAHYNVYRDGSLIANVATGTSYTDSTVAGSRTYEYEVRAEDAAENESTASNAATVTSPTADTSPPTTPQALTAQAVGPTRIDLSWKPSSDNTAVAGYEITRNGLKLAGIDAPATAYSDISAASGSTYSYTVTALDGAGNRSPASAAASATTPRQELFRDGFETGNLSQWSTVSGIVAQQQDVFGGAWGARAISNGTATYAYKNLAPAQSILYYRLRFRLASSLSSQMYLMKIRTAAKSLAGVYVTSLGNLAYRNDLTAVSTISSTPVTVGTWHELQLRAQIAGPDGAVEVFYDGVRVAQLSRVDALGTDAISRIQLGENLTGRTYDVAYDDVVLDTAYIQP